MVCLPVLLYKEQSEHINRRCGSLHESYGWMPYVPGQVVPFFARTYWCLAGIDIGASSSRISAGPDRKRLAIPIRKCDVVQRGDQRRERGLIECRVFPAFFFMSLIGVPSIVICPNVTKLGTFSR